ncbi:hypothetical protein [Pseudonocardia hydrocarbonoxydans]|uniref:hypothetical protein n=1 Tax=Pseudonocardia hydrocarbonoxydans TaxID=76726 RepID=UPI0031D22031
MRPAWSDPAAAAGAAVIAGVVAVGADIAAGGTATHTLALGLLALVLGVLRLGTSGRARGANTAAAGALLSQPVLHAITTLVPSGPDTGHTTHALVETPVALGQLLLAAVIVMSVASVEPLLHRCLRWRPRTVLRFFSHRSIDVTLPAPPELTCRHMQHAAGQQLRLRAPPAPLVTP